MARDDLGRSGRLTHRCGATVSLRSVLASGDCATAQCAQSTLQIRRLSVLMAIVDSDQEAQARVATLRDALKLGWIEDRNLLIDVRWSTSDAVDGTRRAEMAISLRVFGVACFTGAAISFLRYDSKYFDLLVLSGVIFIGIAMHVAVAREEVAFAIVLASLKMSGMPASEPTAISTA